MRILLEVSQAFSPYDWRSTWLKKMINTHLAPQTEPSESEFVPEICDHGLSLLLRALFAPLKASVEIDEIRSACAERYGREPGDTALTMLNRLWGPAIDRPTVFS